jgi:hypothetical protein
MNIASLAPLVALNQSIADVINMTQEMHKLNQFCETQSRVIAALVATNGGAVNRSILDQLMGTTGVIGYKVVASGDHAEVVLDTPILSILHCEGDEDTGPSIVKSEAG